MDCESILKNYARSTVKHMELHIWIGRLVPPTSTQLKIYGLYLKLACGNYNRILPNILIQRRDLFKLPKRSGRSWIGLLVDRSIGSINKQVQQVSKMHGGHTKF
jgi:hypothetical protein